MTAHKYYKRGLVTAEQFDGSAEMVEKYLLVEVGGSFSIGMENEEAYGEPVDIGDYLLYEGGELQAYSKDEFFDYYSPLPVIPQAVGKYTEWAKDNELSLVDTMRWQTMPDWALDNSETFALAWLLGEWEEV